MSERFGNKISQENVGEEIKADVDIVLMRHGKQEGIWAGHTNPTYNEFRKGATKEDLSSDRNAAHLSEEGGNQIRESLEKIIPKIDEIKLIIASPNVRAQESAQIVKEYIKENYNQDVEIRTSELAREIDLNPDIFSEEEYEKLMKEGGFQKVMQTLGKMCYENNPQMGETINDVYSRAARLLVYLRRIKKWTSRDKVLVITHGGIARAVKHVTEKGLPENFETETQAISPAEFYGLEFNPDNELFEDQFAVLDFKD